MIKLVLVFFYLPLPISDQYDAYIETISIDSDRQGTAKGHHDIERFPTPVNPLI